MKRDEYFDRLQEPFDWELEEYEKDIAVRLAKKHGGENVLRAWHEFQKDYPLNNFADFEKLSDKYFDFVNGETVSLTAMFEEEIRQKELAFEGQ